MLDWIFNISYAAPASNNTIAKSFLGPNFTNIVYGALIVFFIYSLYKSYSAKKKLSSNRQVFKKPVSKFVFIIVILVVAFGAYNIWYGFQSDLLFSLSGLLMIILGVFFVLYSVQSIIVAEDGIFGDNKVFTWDVIKKWAWNTESAELVLQVKQRGKSAENIIIRASKEQIVEINDAIRKYKLGK